MRPSRRPTVAHADPPPGTLPGTTDPGTAPSTPPAPGGSVAWLRVAALLGLALVAALLGARSAAADTITPPNPTSYTMRVGETITIEWVVSDTAGAPEYCRPLDTTSADLGTLFNFPNVSSNPNNFVSFAAFGDGTINPDSPGIRSVDCFGRPTSTLGFVVTANAPGTGTFALDTVFASNPSDPEPPAGQPDPYVFPVNSAITITVVAPTPVVTGVRTGDTIRVGALDGIGCSVNDPLPGGVGPELTFSGNSGNFPRVVTATCTYRDSAFGPERTGRATFTVTKSPPSFNALTYQTATDEDTDSTPLPLTVSDELVPAADLTVTVSGGQYGEAFISGTGATRQLVYRPDPDVSGVSDEVVVRVDDGLGGSSIATVDVFINWVSDAPVFTARPADGAVVTATTSGDATTAVASWSVTATDADASGGATTVTCSASIGGATVAVTPATAFPAGDTEVTCAAADVPVFSPVPPGPSATTRFTVRVLDGGAPAITVPASTITAEATGPAGASVPFAVSATDAIDGDDVTVTCTVPAEGDRAVASGATFAVGSTTVSCVATDAAGNTDTGSFTVTVSDSQGPTLDAGTLPGSGSPRVLAVEATGPRTPVTWPAVTATDTVDGTITLTCRVGGGAPVGGAGTTFPLGDTLVTCAGEDGAGNEVSAAFSVRVADTVKPVLSLPAPTSVEATSAAGAVVTWQATATDTLDGALAVTCLPASGGTFAVGTTTVTCSATDAAGNRAEGTFDVTVRDNTPPAFVPGTLVNRTAAATSNYGVPVSFPLPVATDTYDPEVVVTCDRASGAQFPIGTTIVTCVATDDTGQSATGTFTVTVDRNGFRDPRDPRPGASPITAPPTTPTPRPARPPRG
jgi:hypothetical protein